MKRGTPDHPKVAKLASMIGLPIPWALPYTVGLLEMLWHFTAKFAPRGDIAAAYGLEHRYVSGKFRSELGFFFRGLDVYRNPTALGGEGHRFHEVIRHRPARFVYKFFILSPSSPPLPVVE